MNTQNANVTFRKAVWILSAVTVVVVVDAAISRYGRTNTHQLASVDQDKPLAEPRLLTPNPKHDKSESDPTDVKLNIPRKRYVVYTRDSKVRIENIMNGSPMRDYNLAQLSTAISGGNIYYTIVMEKQKQDTDLR